MRSIMSMTPTPCSKWRHSSPKGGNSSPPVKLDASCVHFPPCRCPCRTGKCQIKMYWCLHCRYRKKHFTFIVPFSAVEYDDKAKQHGIHGEYAGVVLAPLLCGGKTTDHSLELLLEVCCNLRLIPAFVLQECTCLD